MPCSVKGFLGMYDLSGHKRTVAETCGHVVREPCTLKCSSVTCMETGLISMKQVSFLKFPLYIVALFYQIVCPLWTRGRSGVKIEKICGSCGVWARSLP